MKEGIHPSYHEINVVMTDGTTYKTFSTWGKPGDTMTLDVDPKSHPAWNGGGAMLNQRASQVSKFNNKFGNLGVKGPEAAAKKEAPKAEVQASVPQEPTPQEAPTPQEIPVPQELPAPQGDQAA